MDVEKKIKVLLSLLSNEQKKLDLIVLDKSNDAQIISFLEEEGELNFEWKSIYNGSKPLISHNRSNESLWEKDINNNWIIKIEIINKIFKEEIK